MQRPGNTLLPAVIVILAITATIGVYAFSVWPTDQELNVNTPQITQQKNLYTNSEVTTESMKDWKTYTNTRLGYSIKYPPAWLSPATDAATATFTSQSYSSETATEPAMLLISASSTTNPQEALSGTRKNVVINGLTAVQQDEPGISTNSAIYFSTGNSYVLVVYEKIKAEFALMASSFTFTK